MRMALELAERGWGRVAPNPMVGAVVVKDGEVVAQGYHSEWGGAHAEAEALDRAGVAARGATLYVTLEPCHHTGKTGPCSRVILEAGIRRLVCATTDPNPEAAGGAAWLRERGIEVDFGLCELEAMDLNAAHFTACGHGRPFVALKYAISLDARLSESPGAPTRVSEGEAIREAHRLRAGHDAVMVGIGTVLADDPQLTVREWDPPRVPPLRVVLDSALRLPPASRLAQSAREVPVRVFTGEGVPGDRVARLEELGVDVEPVPSARPLGLDLGVVIERLWARGVRSVLCEGGGTLGSALLAAGKIDRLYAFVAPILLGEPGVPAFQGPRGRAARNWRMVKREGLGAIMLLVLSPD